VTRLPIAHLVVVRSDLPHLVGTLRRQYPKSLVLVDRRSGRDRRSWPPSQADLERRGPDRRQTLSPNSPLADRVAQYWLVHREEGFAEETRHAAAPCRGQVGSGPNLILGDPI
jgi:hypothetical protein